MPILYYLYPQPSIGISSKLSSIIFVFYLTINLFLFIILMLTAYLQVVYRGVAQLGRAPRSGRGGRAFESRRPDEETDIICDVRFFICPINNFCIKAPATLFLHAKNGKILIVCAIRRNDMMFKKKKAAIEKNNDKKLLLDAMQQIIDKNYAPVDTTTFADPELAEKFNEVILSLKQTNNVYLMKINHGMELSGNNSCVKKMVEQVTSQTEAIQNMSAASKDFEASIHSISDDVEHIKKDAQNAMEISQSSMNNMNETIAAVTNSVSEIRSINENVLNFQEKIEQITNIADMVKKVASQSGLLALNASIEAARAGEAGKGFAVVASQVKELSNSTTESADTIVKYVTELQASIEELTAMVNNTTMHLEEGNAKVQRSVLDISNLGDRMNLINGRIMNIFDAINTQSDVTNDFVQMIDSIAESYNILTEDCITTGNHLYRIGRYIDTTRNNMARGFTALTTQDWLRVFRIDHHTFTWRVYNNLANFEHLKIEQLNNPKGCKLGKWAASQTDPRIVNSKELKNMLKHHEDLHYHACDSWYAAEDGNRELALHHFNLTLESYNLFSDAMEQFKELLRTLGIVDETVTESF